MRVLARLRCGYAAFRVGDSKCASEELPRANAILDNEEGVARYRTDAAALHAHLLELDGGIELARAGFRIAHELALEDNRPGRAATTASDVGRLLAERGQLADALEWQYRALGILKKTPDEFINRTVQIRLARIEIALRMDDRARKRLKTVQEQCRDCLTPDALIAVNIALTELGCIVGPREAAFDSGLALLEAARDCAERSGLKPLQVRVEREFAQLYALTKVGPDRRRYASPHYVQAIRMALELTTTPGLKLQHFAETLLRFRHLVLPARYGQETYVIDRVADALQEFRSSMRAGVSGYHHRRETRERKRDALRHALSAIAAPDRPSGTIEIGEYRCLVSREPLQVFVGAVKVAEHKPCVGKLLQVLHSANAPIERKDLQILAECANSTLDYSLSQLEKYFEISKSSRGRHGLIRLVGPAQKDSGSHQAADVRRRAKRGRAKALRRPS